MPEQRKLGAGRVAAYVLATGAVFAGGYFAGGYQSVAPKEVNIPVQQEVMDEAAVRRVVESYIRENPVVIMQSVDEYQRNGFTRGIADRAAPYQELLENTYGVPVVGDATAMVKIVEFFDYQCPHCKANYPVLKRILAEDPSVVLVPKQLPILGDGSESDMSRYAAKAALAAHKQGRFAPFHEALMDSPVPLSPKSVAAIAADLGLDLAKFESDRKSQEVHEELEASLEIAQDTGFAQAGTPGYLIGGQVSIGAGEHVYERLRELIAAAKEKL